MERIWLALVISGILVLITAMGLFAFVPLDDITTAPVFSVGRAR
jgi:hypothetical protein